MNSEVFRNRLLSVLNRIEPILNEYGKTEEVLQVKSTLSEHLAEQDLINIKQYLVTLLNDTLTIVQLKFVETEEPTNEEIEMYRKYLIELKDYKQELSTPFSEIRKKVSNIIKETRMSLNSDLSNQAISFPSEYLDLILKSDGAKNDKNGDWVVSQVNEGLNALSQDVSLRLAACADAINEVLDCKIDSVSSCFTSSIQNEGIIAPNTSDRVFGISRQALPAIGLGGLSTTLVATIANPILGLLAGAAVGGSFLYKSVKSTDSQQKFIELKQRLAPRISLAINEMKNQVTEELSEIEENVNNYATETCKIIADEMQTCMDAIKECENDRREFYKRLEILNGHMTFLETYIKQIELMMSNPFDTEIIKA